MRIIFFLLILLFLGCDKSRDVYFVNNSGNEIRVNFGNYSKHMKEINLESKGNLDTNDACFFNLDSGDSLILSESTISYTFDHFFSVIGELKIERGEEKINLNINNYHFLGLDLEYNGHLIILSYKP